MVFKFEVAMNECFSHDIKETDVCCLLRDASGEVGVESLLPS